jgi:hypothetical protein
MPFKALASLKKVGTLDAEIVGIAPLENDQLVGVVSNDPVKVALYPYGSGSTKVKNVGLDNVGGLALINKAVAVVRSGGELWAVLDLQHTPKVEQVGRDIRSLCHFPKGGTALAVGFDGHGAALAIEGGREVGGRQFTLRGDVRTAVLDMTHCYVVVNGVGGPGGQLRVHPGQTPENAATARADLPSDATGMNRIGAAPGLIALAKRGADKVVVVRQQGNALEPHVLAVPGGVVDVAVMETSMFVLGADGKVRLYNGEMLAKLGKDILEPTSIFDLKVKDPTVIVATQRGGNKLWVGTKSGDVLRCDAIKGDLNIGSF